MNYFAYGSNMSVARLRARVPSAVSLGCHSLKGHDLRFHKSGRDGSGKCDAYFTSIEVDVIYGVLFEIDKNEKAALDKIEGLGLGYDEKEIMVTAHDGSLQKATTYVASIINANLKPYSWYMNHVLIGAQEASLPVVYVQQKIWSVEVIGDANKARDAEQRAIHCYTL
ncbi:MAG: gamma-glutamylcyclotransferase [Gammaproteobacteria bacterium]|nr:gamma-glutamylcyclotransferase [Gammaproteobacteria bacterium]